MLEHQNDNLPQADGNPENFSSSEQQQPVSEHQKSIDEIENLNAEESEDASLAERHQIPMKEYETMSMEQLVSELTELVDSGRVASIKYHVEEIKKAFNSQFHDFIETKREEYATANDGETIGFEYHSPLKQKFDALLDTYKDRRQKHYQQLENTLKTNLNTRLQIIEELKNLITPDSSIPDLFKRFNEIRERWKNAGPIPKDKYNHVWNSYQFHIENFYDYVDLDREARDLDFKYNLEQKTKVIERAKALLEESDLNKIFRELQLLHKLWKEELGPVAKEHRDRIWNEFSAITKQIHDKREAYFQQIREQEQKNLTTKQTLIDQITTLAEQSAESHAQWQKLIEQVNQLREQFFQIGRVPMELRDATWEKFKDVTKEFNVKKNAFYRNIKSEQQKNLNAKLALLDKARELKDSSDFDKVTPIMKQIQEDWKSLGHVPKKYSDEIWSEFKKACNHYFDRLHQHRNQANQVEIEAYEKKKVLLDQVRSLTLTGEHKADLDLIKSQIETWKAIGKVPMTKRHIEGKFNKVLDGLFDKLSMSKKEAESVRYNNRISSILESDDTRKINSERIFLTRKIEDIKSEIRQLENNVLYITSSKNNNLVNEVNKSIERHKAELATWIEKFKQFNQALSKSNENSEEA